MPPVGERRSRQRRGREQVRADIVLAATELLRDRSFGELTVHDLMAEAGQGRTVFYRHFDDLGDLLRRAAREPATELLEAQQRLVAAGPSSAAAVIREALTPSVQVYVRHGPVLRAVREAAAADPLVARDYAAFLARFEDLAAEALRELAGIDDDQQTARALNLMTEAYLVDAFGGEPRVSAAVALDTITGIWIAVATR
jgi:TetR/AcrR family transcriptional regulator, ethionamide resistance regulator